MSSPMSAIRLYRSTLRDIRLQVLRTPASSGFLRILNFRETITGHAAQIRRTQADQLDLQ